MDRTAGAERTWITRKFATLLEGRLLSIMRPDLEAALRGEMTDQVDVRFAVGVAAVDNSLTGVCVTSPTARASTQMLLVGADGIHSTVRRLVFGPEDQFFRYRGFHSAAHIFDDREMRRRLHDRFYLTDSTRQCS